MADEFFQDVIITYFSVDNKLLLKPSSLVLYLQDLAIEHSNSLGYTLEYLAEKKRGWAITNYHITIDRFPKCGEKIKIYTWSCKCSRMQAERCFRVEDENGNVIIKAMTRWIFMDLYNRCPVEIEEDMQKAYYSPVPAIIEDEKYIMPKASEKNIFLKKQFAVTRSSMDTNGHANNAKYIEWAIDDVPDEIYDNFSLKDIKVVYRKECYKDYPILSNCYISGTPNEARVISVFSDIDDEKVVFSEVVSSWSKKEE